MKTKIELPPETQSAIARLRDDAGMLLSLVPVIDDQNELTVKEIQEKRLKQRGPETLGVRTARLWQSIVTRKAIVMGGAIHSGIGSNVKYLGVHEFGFEGEEQVRPHKRKIKRREVIFGKRRVVRKGDVDVRGFKRHMVIKERAPLRRGINAREEAYRQALRQGIIKFYEGK